MSLNKRQERLIAAMNNSKSWMTGKELSRMMGVSDRTIRSDIDTINRFYEDVLIESSMKQGYRLVPEVLNAKPMNIKDVIPQTPDERCSYVLKELLFKKKKMNLMDLQDKVFASGYTIENDLKRIRKIIEPYEGLSLERSKNELWLNGPEESKRNLYKDLLDKETQGNFINLDHINAMFPDLDLAEVKKTLMRILNRYDYRIRETSIPMLLMHIGISLQRMMNNNYVNHIQTRKDIEGSIEYQISSSFFHHMEGKYPIVFSTDEAVLIALIMMGKNSIDYTADMVEINGVVYSIEEVVTRMLEDIRDEFEVDFLDDEILKNDLTMHMGALIRRTRDGSEISNVYLYEIKCRYPLIFDMSVRAAKSIKRQTGLQIDDHEIGFLALHFGSAYESRNMQGKYKAVLIYPGEGTLTNVCLRRLETHFGERMEVVERVNVFEEQHLKALRPDLILTSVSLQHQLPIPTVEISLFIDGTDESKIFQALNLLDKEKGKEEFRNTLQKMIKPEFFYQDVTADSYEELIRMMCTDLETYGYADRGFAESVLEREKMSSTSFNIGLAIPHALKECSLKSCLSIAVMKKPVQWGEFEVKLVILLAVKDENREIIRIFFDWMSSIVNDSARFLRLTEAKNIEQFIARILEE